MKDLDFHTESEQHPVRIRNAIMLDGHATDLPSIPPECSCKIKTELSEDQQIVSRYAKRIRDNLHHKKDYCPCKRIEGAEYMKNG